MLQARRLTGERSVSLQPNVPKLEADRNAIELLLSKAQQTQNATLSALISIATRLLAYKVEDRQSAAATLLELQIGSPTQ